MRLIVAMITVGLLFVTSVQAHGGYRERNSAVIHKVFGKYGSQAVRVAECESGLTIGARNGQYLGLFQMGDFARSTYRHSWHAWGQARAAYRYFVASGRDWSPWSCKPW
jgi:hypothetical protein